VLRIPCLTLRENTERPATVVAGWNRIVGTDPDRVLAEVDTLLAGPVHGGAAPEKWDGRAGERIARVLLQLGPEGVRRLRKRPEVVAAAAGAR
jgi:UDP-N-acetylglucosamine 2-epimerase (non-hydrolysing)